MRDALRLAAGAAATLVIAAVLVAVSGANPITAAGGLLDGAFGDRYAIGETVVRALPLAVVALGVAPALRAGVFTVGSEGALAVGAMTSTATILAVRELPAVALVAIGCVAGAAGGGLWAFVPAVLRGRLGVNEILSTLLMNYLAASLLLWSLRSWLSTPEPVATPRSENLPAAARIPVLLGGTRLHWGVVAVVVAAAALAWWVRSSRGLAYDVFGARPVLASRLGVVEWRAVTATMVTAGAAAGVVGWLQVAGLQGTLYPSVAGGLGFSGVLVALLGDLRPAGVVVAALFFGALSSGADGLQAGTGVPASIATVFQGVLLLAAALAFAARQRRVRRELALAASDRSAEEPPEPSGHRLDPAVTA